MGCGVGKYEQAPDTTHDDSEDHKLREYLKMKGINADEMREPPKVGMSPAEARRRGISTSGATPGVKGEISSRMPVSHVKGEKGLSAATSSLGTYMLPSFQS